MVRACPICQGPHRLFKGDPLAVERSTPARLAGAFKKVPSRFWARRPKAKEWSMVEVLSHLADAEVAFGFRLRQLISEPRPTLPAWDQEAWATGLRYNERDPRHLLATFRALRGSNLAILRAVPRARWRRVGVHPEYGPVRLDELVAHFAEHDLNHLNQLEAVGAQILQASRARH